MGKYMNRNRELCEMFHKLWCKWGNPYAFRQYQAYFIRYQGELAK